MRITKNIMSLSFVSAVFLLTVSCAELLKDRDGKSSASDSDAPETPKVETSTGMDMTQKQQLLTVSNSDVIEETPTARTVSEADLSPKVRRFCEIFRRLKSISTSSEGDDQEYDALNEEIDKELKNDSTKLTEIDKLVLANHMHELFNDETLDKSIHDRIDEAIRNSETLGDIIRSF